LVEGFSEAGVNVFVFATSGAAGKGKACALKRHIAKVSHRRIRRMKKSGAILYWRKAGLIGCLFLCL
jgi:hypothetical protein